MTILLIAITIIPRVISCNIGHYYPRNIGHYYPSVNIVIVIPRFHMHDVPLLTSVLSDYYHPREYPHGMS
jgi:hypothetical protein